MYDQSHQLHSHQVWNKKSTLFADLLGDFNDLRGMTTLTPIVSFCTRGDHILYQVFVKFKCDHAPSCFSPVGNSDHCIHNFWQPPHL